MTDLDSLPFVHDDGRLPNGAKGATAFCVVCGAPRQYTPGRGKPVRFCSERCRWVLKRARVGIVRPLLRTPEERFWAKVDLSDLDGCWPWTAKVDGKGYGRVGPSKRRIGAHRVSWELHFGAVPDGLDVCHTCDNPPCVRPSHLWLGTDADNAHDRDAKGRTSKGERHAAAMLPYRQRRYGHV